MTENELVEKIKEANRNYYLYGESELSDKEYDSMVEELRKLNPDNPILNKVGDDSEAENKIKLPIIMGSLNKTRPDKGDIAKLYPHQDLIRMPKLDGLSMLIEYQDGKFKTLYTRGNGFEGQDITGRAKYMNFPKELTGDIANGITYVIGEAVISRANFKKIKGEYKHPRNTVGGTLRPILTNKEYEEVDESVKENCKLIDIVTYGLIAENIEFDLFSDIMTVLKQNKFIIADYCLINVNDVTPKYMSTSIKDFRTNYAYLTDGIVLRLNDMKLFNALGKEANGLNPKGARAVKANLEDQFSQVGTIGQIEWTMSKRGNFIPVVVLEKPIYFDGVEVTRISGNNVKYVRDNNWTVGARVQVIKSGDVIPRIIATDPRDAQDLDIPTKCPYCGSKLEENDAHIYCPNENCEGRKRAGIIDFFTALELNDVSFSTIAYLYDAGFNSYEKLLSIKYSELIEMEGFQAKKAINVERELNNCLQDITLAKFLYISQCFMNEKTSLGETKLQWVIDAFGEDNILASLNNERDSEGNLKKLDPEILNNIPKFGEASIALFKDNWKELKKLYFRLKPYIKFAKPEFIDNKLEGMSFAFTSFRDPELEQIIISHQGLVKGVTKKTSVLFAASSESSKVKTAEKYGIPIVAAPQAREYIEQLLKEKDNVG